jgi:serine protease
VIRSTVYLLVAAALAALSVALPDSTAHSAAPMTAKQAQLKGLTVSAKSRPEPMVGRMIVKLRGDSLGASAQSNRAVRMKELESTAGAEMAHERDLAGGAALLSLKAPVSLSEAKAVAARLVRDPAVEYAEPDIMMKRTVTPTEPRFIEWQWNLFAPTATYTGTSSTGNKSSTAVGGANMQTAWDLNTGSSDVVVAVIDTGIVNHTDLNGVANAEIYVPAGRFLAGYDFISSDVGVGTLPANFVANDGNGRDADPSDPGDWITAQHKLDYAALCDDGNAGDSNSSWHGSHMAGTLAATTNNALGIAGVAWNVRVLPVRALGRCGGSLSDIGEAIRWAAGLAVPNVPANPTPAQVISLSLGGGDTCSTDMQNAVNAAIANGSVIVAATGNEGRIGTISPANCSGAIGVTAHTINGENADYANIGTGTAISAPGGGTPTLLGAGGPTDDSSWQGYFVWSALLFGNTTPTSSDSSNPPRVGPAYGGFTGTSSATPHVAGVAALVKSFVKAATPGQISSLLTTNVRPYPTGSACAAGGAFAGMCGSGLLDATLVMNAAAINANPMASAGADQVVAPTTVVALSGTTSRAFGGKSITTYQWTQTAGAPTVTLNTPNAATTTFTAPATGNLTFRLTVTDNTGLIGQDMVSVRINSAPVLGAVSNQTATSGQILSFAVTATDADNDTLTFAATNASTAPMNALGPTGQFTWNTTGVAAGTYQLVYFATDGIAQSSTQTVTITIDAAPPGGGGVPPPTGGGGGGGALPFAQLLLLAALLLGARIKRGEEQSQ